MCGVVRPGRRSRPSGLCTCRDLPALAGGDYLLDAVARDDRGNSLGWGTWAVSVAAQSTLNVTLTKRFISRDKPRPLRRRWAEGTALEGTYTATLQVWDSLDRLLHGRDQASGRRPSPVDVCQSRSAVRAALCRRTGPAKRRPYLASRTDLFVPRYTFTDFHNCLWGAWLPGYATRRIDRRLREGLGCDIMLCGGYGGSHKHGNYGHLAAGHPLLHQCRLRLARRGRTQSRTREAGGIQVGRRHPSRTETVRRCRDLLPGRTPRLERPGQDHRRRPGVVPRWLKPRYPDIAALNAAWGRQYASFDEVQPLLTKDFDPKQEPSLAPWLEWRLWNMAASWTSTAPVLGESRRAWGTMPGWAWRASSAAGTAILTAAWTLRPRATTA